VKIKDKDGNIMLFATWKHVARFMMRMYGWSEVSK